MKIIFNIVKHTKKDKMNSSSINRSHNAISNSTNPSAVGKTVAWCLAYGVIGIITVLGNSLTIAVFMRKNFQRKKLHYILINLAVTDLTVGAISIPMQMTGFIAGFHNTQLSASVNKAHYFVDVLSELTSMYSIAFISIERLIAVCWPFKHRILKLWHYSLAISLTWLISGTVALVSNQILPHRISYLEEVNVRTVFAVIPIVVTIAAYCFLWLIRKERGGKILEEKCNKSIACTLMIVTVVFFCTWSPFIILSSTVGYVCALYPGKCHPLLMKNGVLFAFLFTKLLQYSNSCVNTFIYALRIQSFRDTALEILCCSKIGKLHFIGSRETSVKTSSCDGDTEMRSFSGVNATTEHGDKTHNKTDKLAADQQL